VFDIYYRRIEPTSSYIDYAVFVSFFPLLVAGPIERATHLLPQVKSTRVFSSVKAEDGLRQILWGLFKKVVIADNCAAIANLIFNGQEEYTGPVLVMGAVFFAFQIYGDFSGYSDIALGTARLLGFDLVRNFAFPYFSRSIAEFWRRWHISLSSWFRDYLYMPLGGSRGTSYIRVRNVLIIFLVSGLWHGANWTFLIWGALNALYILPSLLVRFRPKQTDIVAQGKLVPSWREAGAMILTFSLTTFAWIFFRSADVSHAFSYVQRMVMGMFQISSYFDAYQFALTKVGVMIPFFVAVFLVIEWFGREQPFALAKISLRWPLAARWSFYYSLIFFLILFGGKEQQFIYFQF
jgi:D-alanyl-lipoteichoic acid acyltransferase DltB (MBOAT superfamily)